MQKTARDQYFCGCDTCCIIVRTFLDCKHVCCILLVGEMRIIVSKRCKGNLPCVCYALTLPAGYLIHNLIC